MNEPYDVRGVRVLLTGGSRGLGRAMAEALVAGGARVVLAARDNEALERTVKALHGPGEAFGIAADVTAESDVARLVAGAVEWLGGIDVLVNNAGLGMRTVNTRFLEQPMPFWEVSPDGFRRVMDVNVTGYFLVARAVVPHFLQAGRGKIINVSINHETMVRRGFVPYGPSRAASEALSRIMAQDLRPYGIAVNLLLPGGATRTGMIPDDVPDTIRDRLLDPSIMGPPIRFLCSKASDGLSNARIVAVDFVQQGARP